MPSEDAFEPRLGRIRAQTPKTPKSYAGKVLQAVNRAGGKFGALKRRFGGGKYSRGAGVARVLSGTAATGARSRRVVVKVRFVKLAGKGLRAAAAHLRYLQRDGVTREGEKGQLYGAERDQIDAKEFMGNCAEDRHQFRFIVSPEDGNQYDSLKPLTRKVMGQMERDLGTKLDWVATDHYNTGRPHTHIVVRGRDADGKDLVIAREYLSEGFRARVQAQVNLDLGPRSDLEIRTARQAEVTQERMTSIDRQLLREAGDTGQVLSHHRDPFTHGLRVGRLTELERLGLATARNDGAWSLRPDMEATLRQMGEREDIIKTLHRALKGRGLEGALPDSLIHDRLPGAASRIITGRLIERGLADEYVDRHYLIVEGTDGHTHYADVGQGGRVAPTATGAIVRLTPNIPDVRPADLTIAKVAAQNDGKYSLDAHLKSDPTARQAFAETHVRRLEAIRRLTGGVERQADGSFLIGADYPQKALDYEVRQASLSPMKVEVLDDRPLAETAKHPGMTWLDRELRADPEPVHAHARFGQEVRSALRTRMQWLMEEGLATELPNGSMSLHDDYLPALHRRDMRAAADQVGRELRMPYSPAMSGEHIEGTLRRSVEIGTAKYAVVDRGRDFTLVPWRPVLEKHIDKSVSGQMRETGINWSIGRAKGPERD
jgi:type IV secretory pathway VirD2 relaxase